MARKKVKLPDAVAASVPLSSMIDVVFLLLIYFILTQKPVVEDVHMPLDLPAPGSASASDEPPPLMLRVDVIYVPNESATRKKLEKELAAVEASKRPDKNEKVKELREKLRDSTVYYVNSDGSAGGVSQTYPRLKEYLKRIVDSDGKMISQGLKKKGATVVISCDPNARHEKLVTLLDLCEELNVYSQKKYGVDALRQLNLVHDATVKYDKN